MGCRPLPRPPRCMVDRSAKIAKQIGTCWKQSMYILCVHIYILYIYIYVYIQCAAQPATVPTLWFCFIWEALLGCKVLCSSFHWGFRILIPVGSNLDAFWKAFGHLLDAFWMPFGCLLGVFWIPGRPWGPFWWFFDFSWFLERFGHKRVFPVWHHFGNVDDTLAVGFLSLF